MIDVTPYLIDNLNNGIETNEHVSNHLTVYKRNNEYLIYYKEQLMGMTDNVNVVVEYVLKYHIEKD